MSPKPIESVWDFPRPPRIDEVDWRIRVVHQGQAVVDAPRAIRICETSQPPAYYIDPAFVNEIHLRPAPQAGSFCEWKGAASYADFVIDDIVTPQACWTYPTPTARYGAVAGKWAFYAQVADECWVDDERVEANPGSFYGGWITSNVTGPFKGAPGTMHW